MIPGKTVQDQIFEWVHGFDPWKQELFLHASAEPELSAETINQVADFLLSQGGEEKGLRAVKRDDLPGAQGADQPMVIRSLSDLVNVNAIAENQTLTFAPQGLNIVFGKNGAGKTGYSRVLKHAGRTLYRETVLTNIKKDGGPGPSATVAITIGDEQHDVHLDLEKPAPGVLGRICISDSRAGTEYLTSDPEVDYAPATLASLRRLASALKKLDAELDDRLAAAQPSELDLRPFGEGTEVRRFLEALSASISDKELQHLAGLSEDEEKRRQDLRRKKGEIDAQRAPQLRRNAENDAATAERLIQELSPIGDFLGSDAVKAAVEELVELAGNRKAAALSAKEFADQPLGEVGSDPWRKLWDAARTYAQHLGGDLPPDHDPAHCPLCMQRLSAEARQRFQRFEDFVRENVDSKIRASEQAVDARRKALPDLDTFRSANTEAISRLGTDVGGLGVTVSEWLDQAEATVAVMRAGDLNKVEKLVGIDPPPVAALKAWAEQQRKEAAEHAALEKDADQEKLSAELAELEAKLELGQRLGEVSAYLVACREVERLRTAKKETSTLQVSRMMTKLSHELVGAELRDALSQQLGALRFEVQLEVELKLKTVSGTPKYELQLRSVERVPLTDVLSQGEQRRLALAIFLAEMEVIKDCSPVVFDDPTSSVDQEGRRHIARCLAMLAKDRQVIVFTHELSLVRHLQQATKKVDGVSICAQQVRRIRDTAGHVEPDLPWEGLGVKARVRFLNESLKTVRELYGTGDDKKYEDVVIVFSARLRMAFERIVEDDILGEAVTRREDNVRPTNLKKIVCTEEICDLVEEGMDDNSPWVHEKPLLDGGDPPTPDELREGLGVLDRLRAAIKAERAKAASASDSLKSLDGAGEDADQKRPAPGPAQAMLAVAPDPVQASGDEDADQGITDDPPTKQPA